MKMMDMYFITIMMDRELRLTEKKIPIQHMEMPMIIITILQKTKCTSTMKLSLIEKVED
jgi:hypothetical protein